MARTHSDLAHVSKGTPGAQTSYDPAAPASAGNTVITDELAFPPQSTEERAVVHRIAHILGLQHQSRGKGAKGQNGRYVTVRKRTEVEA